MTTVTQLMGPAYDSLPLPVVHVGDLGEVVGTNAVAKDLVGKEGMGKNIALLFGDGYAQAVLNGGGKATMCDVDGRIEFVEHGSAIFVPDGLPYVDDMLDVLRWLYGYCLPMAESDMRDAMSMVSDGRPVLNSSNLAAIRLLRRVYQARMMIMLINDRDYPPERRGSVFEMFSILSNATVDVLRRTGVRMNFLPMVLDKAVKCFTPQHFEYAFSCMITAAHQLIDSGDRSMQLAYAIDNRSVRIAVTAHVPRDKVDLAKLCAMPKPGDRSDLTFTALRELAGKYKGGFEYNEFGNVGELKLTLCPTTLPDSDGFALREVVGQDGHASPSFEVEFADMFIV